MSWWKISEQQRALTEEAEKQPEKVDGPKLRVRRKPCENCLYSEKRLTTIEGRRRILRACREQDTFFNCHKATIKGEIACCHNFYERHPYATTFMRFAAKNKLVEFVD